MKSKKKKTEKLNAKENKFKKTNSNKNIFGKTTNSKKIIIFLVKFLLVFAILNFFIEITNLSILTNFIAGIVASVLGLTAAQNIIIFGGKTFVVTNSCTGLVSASILASIIFALKKPELKKKFALFGLGLVVLLIVNVPRVMLVLFAAQNGFDAELVHEITWYLMSTIIIVLWYYGSKKMFSKKEFTELI